MALDLRRGFDAAAASPYIHGVPPVSEGFNRAIDPGLAAPPCDGLQRGRIDLWALDTCHASAFGDDLEALIAFGVLTGRGPASSGPRETAAAALTVSPAQTLALQEVAHDQLAAERPRVAAAPPVR